eukprot:scaffold98_cov172-Amphora_coffeaeformis.AAC.8
MSTKVSAANDSFADSKNTMEEFLGMTTTVAYQDVKIPDHKLSPSTERPEVAIRDTEQALLDEIRRREKAAHGLLEVVEMAISSTNPSSYYDELHRTAMELLEMSKELRARIQYLAHKYFTEMNQDSHGHSMTLSERLNTKPWTPSALSFLIIVLGDVFEALRELKDTSNKSSGPNVWVAPDAFERKTTKYWVEDESLPELLLTCVGEVPLLVYGKSGRLSNEIQIEDKTAISTDTLWGNFSTKISSVYFDSPGLDLYRERLARREGAQLLRARWYGKRPTSEEPVFLELKTHHESWVQAKSVKERAIILEKDMCAFLYPTEKWNEDRARQALLRATPSMNETKLAKAVDLLLRMHSLVVEHRLRPCMRSTYQRLAFQSSKSNSIRLTLDRDVTVSDERSCPHGYWSVEDDNIIFSPTDARVIPFAVFEIKLGEGQSSTALDELMDKQVILDASKFSKFLTGAATFNKDAVQTFPYWAEHPAFLSFFWADDRMTDSVEGSFIDATRRTTSSLSDSSNFNFACNNKKTKSPEKQSPFDGNQKSGSVDSGKTNKKWVAPKKAVRVEPKTYFANERTFVQWVSAALFLVTTSALLLEVDHGQGYAIVTSKVLLGFASVISVYALYLYYHRIHLVKTGQPYGYVSHFGPLVLTCATIAGTVVIMTQYWKMNSIIDATTGQRGSTADAAAQTVMMQEAPNKCLRHDLGPFSPLEIEPSDVVVDTELNRLLVASMEEILSFPAPIWTREQGLHVPTAADPPLVLATTPGADFEALAYVDSVLYAISEADEHSVLHAFEWDAVDTAEQSVAMTSSTHWTVAPMFSEGIALVQDPRKEEPELYISGSTPYGAANTMIATHDIPSLPRLASTLEDETNEENINAEPSTTPTPSLHANHLLNAKMFVADLVDEKIGAMTFFEGILYILHDNEKLVRAWNVGTGTLQAQWSLPHLPNTNGKQWEGLSFQRIVKPSYLRGTTATTEEETVLLLHLVYDTPASIWTVVVEQGETPGSILLPECAGVVAL